MKLIIKLSDLDKNPCDIYLDHIKENYPDDQEFDAIELINKISKCKYKDVSWLIASYKIAQTKKMLKYYKSLEPDKYDICLLIYACRFARDNWDSINGK